MLAFGHEILTSRAGGAVFASGLGQSGLPNGAGAGAAECEFAIGTVAERCTVVVVVRRSGPRADMSAFSESPEGWRVHVMMPVAVDSLADYWVRWHDRRDFPMGENDPRKRDRDL